MKGILEKSHLLPRQRSFMLRCSVDKERGPSMLFLRVEEFAIQLDSQMFIEEFE